MKYKAILLDIDNTLYDYEVAHSAAKRSVISFCWDEFKIPDEVIVSAYAKSRDRVHTDLVETAASHNRLLYFQKMCELLNLNPLKHALKIYNIYWNKFLEKMKPFDGVDELFQKYNNKVCLVTDLTAHIQFRKIEKLKLSNFCNTMVTSEEAGKEKPHPYIFLLALQKLNLNTNDVCMIGDNFRKDIYGASNLGIDAIWLNHKKSKQNFKNKDIQEVSELADILDLL